MMCCPILGKGKIFPVIINDSFFSCLVVVYMQKNVMVTVIIAIEL